MVTLGLSKMVKRVQNSLIKILEVGLQNCTHWQMKQKEAGCNFCIHFSGSSIKSTEILVVKPSGGGW